MRLRKVVGLGLKGGGLRVEVGGLRFEDDD